jgi:hypothetical protein
MEIALQPITGFQDDTRPSALKSVSYHDYICTAMDHIVIITEKYTIQTRLDLECLVDDLVVAENILVIGDELGTIHFVQLKSGRILFSKVVTEPPCKFTNIILTRLGYFKVM